MKSKFFAYLCKQSSENRGKAWEDYSCDALCSRGCFVNETDKLNHQFDISIMSEIIIKKVNSKKDLKRFIERLTSEMNVSIGKELAELEEMLNGESE